MRRQHRSSDACRYVRQCNKTAFGSHDADVCLLCTMRESPLSGQRLLPALPSPRGTRAAPASDPPASTAQQVVLGTPMEMPGTFASPWELVFRLPDGDVAAAGPFDLRMSRSSASPGSCSRSPGRVRGTDDIIPAPSGAPPGSLDRFSTGSRCSPRRRRRLGPTRSSAPARSARWRLRRSVWPATRP